MVLNDAGGMVDAEWKRIPERYDHVILDTYQIMPNHLHGILQITYPESNRSVGTGLVPGQNILDESVNNGGIDKPKRMGTRAIPTALYDVIGTFKSSYDRGIMSHKCPSTNAHLASTDTLGTSMRS